MKPTMNEMRQSGNWMLWGVAALVLAGCSSTGGGKRAEYKEQTEQVRPLEVPPEFTVPVIDTRYALPDEEGVGSATYTGYNKEIGAVPQSVTVLPLSAKVRLERDGARRWLVVEDSAENIWGQVRDFWLEQGFLLQTDDATAGVLVTDWLENLANLPQRGVRAVLARVFDSMRPNGERDQYRIRIERGKDGRTTEIYVSHHGLREQPGKDGESSRWLPRDSDVELENIMLQKLMAHLIAPRATTPAAPSPTVKPARSGAVSLQQGAQGKWLLIDDEFDRVWRKVGIAVDKAMIPVIDKDRSKGVFYLRPEAESSKRKSVLHPQIVLRTAEGGIAVTVENEDGGSDAGMTRLVELLFQHIEK